MASAMHFGRPGSLGILYDSLGLDGPRLAMDSLGEDLATKGRVKKRNLNGFAVRGQQPLVGKCLISWAQNGD